MTYIILLRHIIPASFIIIVAIGFSSFATADELNDSIAANRMGTIEINAPANTRVHIEQLRHEFWFGAALSSGMFRDDSPSPTAQKYRQVFLDNFNAAVTENALKWPSMEYRQGEVNFSTVDNMLRWTDEHDIPLRGHNIYWGVPNFVQPWVKELDDKQLHATLEKRGHTIGRRYRDRFAEYDLNNEMIHANYYANRLGEGITRKMADWIKQEDPNAVLFLNDYDILTGNQLDKYIDHIKTLKSQGVRIDGIGVQGHLHSDTFDPEALKNALDRLAEFDMPIRITEFNMPGQRSKSYNNRELQLTPEEEQRKAEKLVEYYRICFAHPGVDGILMWGFWEGANWIPQSSLYKKDWTPTPAAKAYHDLIYHQWWTDWQGKTEADGQCKVPAFFGKYRVTIDGKSQVVNLSSKQKTLHIHADNSDTE